MSKQRLSIHDYRYEFYRHEFILKNFGHDAFGRVRVSDPFTVFDSKQIVDKEPLFWDDAETSGGGTSTTHSVNRASTVIGVSATTAGVRVRQTKMRFRYQPGKSQLILLTGVMVATGGGAGITCRIGQFDASNGLFFEYAAGTLKVVRRTNVTGTPADNPVEQSAWNLDKLDGTGHSGVTLDPTKANIFFIDYEWLGVGSVRFGVVVDGLPIYCHRMLHANSLTSVYMSSPNLPLRYEITNGGTGAASTLEHICSTVISEGGTQDTGVVRYLSTAGTHLDANVENTLYAMLGLRLKAAALGTRVDILGITAQCHTALSELEWVLILNPTIGGSPSWGDITNSSLQSFAGATANTLTDGTLISGGHFETGGAAAGGSGSVGASVTNSLRLGASIAGTADTIVLGVRPIAGAANVDVEGSITWRESV